MNITIIGASVGVGLATTKRALELGHTVSTLSRRAIAIANNPKLHTVMGSALDENTLKEIINGSDAILVTLGTGISAKATTLYSDFANLLCKIHSEELIQVPVIVVTGFGAGKSYAFLNTMLKPAFRFILNKVYADKKVMEEIIESSTLRWEIVRPGALNNKPLTEKYRVETKLFKGMNIGGISRNDVADYLVKEAVAQKHIGQYPALSNK